MVCENDYVCEDEYCDEFYVQYDDTYDYADPEEPYASNATTQDAAAESEETPCADDTWDYEDTCCDEYAYDGYDGDDEIADVESNAADGLVDKPEESEYSDVEYGYEDFGYDYDYDEMYAHDEHMYAEEENLESSDEEAYSYEFEDEYGHDEDWARGDDEAYAIDDEEDETDEYDEEYYDDYGYDEEYAYDDSEMSSLEEQPEAVAEAAAEDVDSNVEDDLSYEFEDYEMYYGYEEERTELAEEATTAEPEIAEGVAEEAVDPHESDWEDYYYEDEYENDSQPVAEETAAAESMDDVSRAEEAWADGYEYDEYEYDTYGYDANDYDYEYDMEDSYEADAVTEESAETMDESYDYADPMDQYGYEYEMSNELKEMEAEEEAEVGLDLFAWQPTELLHDGDINLIRSIERLSGRPADRRRACLNEYIEALGFEAIDFAYRYEDATDADVLTLADDLPGAAAFLASYRLVEQGQIGTDDAVVLLEGALSGLSLDWIEDVGRIASPAEESAGASHPVVDAMAAAATHSIAGMSALAAAVSRRLGDLPWAELSGRLEEIRSAFRPLGSDDALTF